MSLMSQKNSKSSYVPRLNLKEIFEKGHINVKLTHTASTTEEMFEMLSADSGLISMVALDPMTKCDIWFFRSF